MIENISPGYGYTAIVVALLGRTNPPAVLIAAILFAGLQVGASTMESAVGVPSSIATIIQYLIVLLIMGRGTWSLIQHALKREGQPA
jgi:simple sugar transport system permease protein